MPNNQLRTIICPFDSRYRIVLDASEIFLVDPGEGTPAMVHGPEGEGTYFCVLDTADLDGTTVSRRVHAWVASVEDQVNSFLGGESPPMPFELRLDSKMIMAGDSTIHIVFQNLNGDNFSRSEAFRAPGHTHENYLIMMEHELSVTFDAGKVITVHRRWDGALLRSHTF